MPPTVNTAGAPAPAPHAHHSAAKKGNNKCHHAAGGNRRDKNAPGWDEAASAATAGVAPAERAVMMNAEAQRRATCLALYQVLLLLLYSAVYCCILCIK